MTYSLIVNGASAEIDRSGLDPLLDVLREDLGLTGAKPGCAEGRCGSCTVLVDGAPVVSCLFPLALASGREVRTVEGLSRHDEPLTRIQDELLAHGGVQCGACIPGMLITLSAHLENGGFADERAVREAIAGNACRCTGYQHIVAAAVAADGRNGGAA
jgi:aerobic-type carbon monoxide dehydrogenase small subunit (CoxS/CutS family)